jgi:hypothetical protein
MPARKSDQVLVRFLRSTKALAQAGNRSLFEGDHRRHCREG